MLNDIFDMSFISFFFIVKKIDLVMVLVISYFITFVFHLMDLRIMKNKIYSALTMIFSLFILISIINFNSFYNEYHLTINDKEILELISIKNAKDISTKDKVLIAEKIKEISADFKINYFEFLKIKLMYNQAQRNVLSMKKEQLNVAKIASLNTESL